MSQHVIKLPIKNGYKYVSVSDEYFLTLNLSTTQKQTHMDEGDTCPVLFLPPIDSPPHPLSDSQIISPPCEKNNVVQGDTCFFSPKNFFKQRFLDDPPEQFLLVINGESYMVVKE